MFADQRYEADDLVGTLARQAVQQGVDVVVVSNDKDLMQLVSPRVSFYDFARDRRYQSEEVTAHMGVRPEQIPDLLGLQGDAVDNIPGVKGVGVKTAVALLQAFPSIEAIYADLGRVETLPIRGAKSLRRKLESERDNAVLSKQLATIAIDALRCTTLRGFATGGRWRLRSIRFGKNSASSGCGNAFRTGGQKINWGESAAAARNCSARIPNSWPWPRRQTRGSKARQRRDRARLQPVECRRHCR